MTHYLRCRHGRVLFTLFLSLFFAGCASTRQLGPSALQLHSLQTLTSEQKSSQAEHILYGYPGLEGRILYREGYVLSHNNQTKVANWASYHIKDSYLVEAFPRLDNFKPDPDLPGGERAELVDYEGSGYDRGHLVPADDMKRSKKTMSESFYLSNTAPQVPSFNRGIWRALEAKVRKWAKQRKSIHVMTGPIFTGSTPKTIGSSRVAVPTHFYKIVVSGTRRDNLDSIAFIFPNEANPSASLSGFITTVDEIEKLTRLDFLNELEDVAEEKIESAKATLW